MCRRNGILTRLIVTRSGTPRAFSSRARCPYPFTHPRPRLYRSIAATRRFGVMSPVHYRDFDQYILRTF